MWWLMVSVTAVMGAVPGACIPCEEARVRCALREGCGGALQHYLVGCSAVLQGPPPTYCPEICQYSLIALTSTEEGKELMNCECSDDYCEDQKIRSEVCRPSVQRSMSEPVVSCRVAQWICTADNLCYTALEYYNRNCRAMFHGKKCTPRCNNSISILRRQEKAARLKNCRCDGLEDYDCRAIHKNMDKLCFHKHPRHHQNASAHHPTPSRPPPAPPTTTTDHPDNDDLPTVVLYSGAAGTGVDFFANSSFFWSWLVALAVAAGAGAGLVT